MARFRNLAQHALDFHLGGATGPHIKVGVGGEITVADRIAFAVKASKLPLERIDEPEQTPALPAVDDAPPTHPVARVWYARAIAARREAEAMAEAAGDHQQRAREGEATLQEATAFVERVRKRLDLEPEDSVFDRLDELLHAEREVGRLRAELDEATAPPRAAAAAPPPVPSQEPGPGPTEPVQAPRDAPEAPAAPPPSPGAAPSPKRGAR